MPGGRIALQFATIDARWPGARRRAVGILLAVAIEAVLFLAILTLGMVRPDSPPGREALTSVTLSPEPETEQPERPPQPEQAAQQSALPRPVPRRDSSPISPSIADLPAVAASAPAPLPAVIPLTPSQLPAPASGKARAVIRGEMGGPMGPPDTGTPGDSEVVGRTAAGEPIYAARWHREPTDDELRGYLSTATPGWALINCRTEPGFRVDQCVLVDEWPSGSNMGRAVLAAAWQLQVRPPRKGGRSLVGEWVRIKISYDLRRR